MLIGAILSGEEAIERTNTQIEVLEKALRNLREANMNITIVLDSGKKIVISRVLEGGDSHNRFLDIEIQD
jgi:hypothetical protein